MDSKLDYSDHGHDMHGHHAAPHGGAHHTSSSQYFTSKYIRNSKAVGILWGIFTICSAVLNIVVFASENWVGDTATSKGPGHFGLWKFCTVLSSDAESAVGGGKVVCIGEVNNFGSILSPAFRAASVFVGLSVLVMLLCVGMLITFLCCKKSSSVFEICGTMQFLSGKKGTRENVRLTNIPIIVVKISMKLSIFESAHRKKNHSELMFSGIGCTCRDSCV